MKPFWLRIIPVFGILLLGFCADTYAQSAVPGREPRASSGASGGYTAPPEMVSCGYCKTKEEIAWDLMMYGFQNIPPLRARMKEYDDLLDAYRRALRVVRGTDR